MRACSTKIISQYSIKHTQNLLLKLLSKYESSHGKNLFVIFFPTFPFYIDPILTIADNTNQGTFEIDDNEYQVNAGTEFGINCSAFGNANEPFTVTWYRKGQCIVFHYI